MRSADRSRRRKPGPPDSPARNPAPAEYGDEIDWLAQLRSTAPRRDRGERQPRDPRQSGDPRQPRDPRQQPRDPRQSRDPQPPQDPRRGRDPRAAQGRPSVADRGAPPPRSADRGAPARPVDRAPTRPVDRTPARLADRGAPARPGEPVGRPTERPGRPGERPPRPPEGGDRTATRQRPAERPPRGRRPAPPVDRPDRRFPESRVIDGEVTGELPAVLDDEPPPRSAARQAPPRRQEPPARARERPESSRRGVPALPAGGEPAARRAAPAVPPGERPGRPGAGETGPPNETRRRGGRVRRRQEPEPPRPPVRPGADAPDEPPAKPRRAGPPGADPAKPHAASDRKPATDDGGAPAAERKAATRGSRSALRDQFRQVERLRLITLACVTVVLLGALPGFFFLKTITRDPGFRALDALEAPAWAAQNPADSAAGSRWCVPSCRVRQRTWESQRAPAQTAAAYQEALKAEGWVRWEVDGCPPRAVRGDYSCWRRDEHTLDLWARPASCRERGGGVAGGQQKTSACPESIVIAVVRNAGSDARLR